MRNLVLSLLTFLSFHKLSASAPKNEDLIAVQNFASQILNIHEENSELTHKTYRAVLAQNSEKLKRALKNPELPRLITQDKRLSTFLKGKEALLPYISTMVLPPVPNAPLEVTDAQIDTLDSSINATAKDFKFSETTAVAMLLDPNSGVNLRDVPPTLRNFLDLVLHRYFDALDVPTKRAILADVVLMDEDAPPEEVLVAILNHCGPVLQKSFQLFSKDVRSEKLTTALNQLRQNIKPFPRDIAKARIESEAGISVEREFAFLPAKPVAAATIGQVYLLHKRNGTKVIVKVQRPGVAKKAEEEFTLLRSLTGDELVLKFVADLEDSLKDELNFETERANLRAGKIYAGQMNGQLHVIEELPEYKSTSKVLFLSCAKGKSFEKYGPEVNYTKVSALKELLYVWVHEALFGARIFHADLHPGNMFLELGREYEDGDFEFVLTLIDFGSIGSFTVEEAKGLFLILVGLSYQKNQVIFDGLKGIAKWKADVTEDQIHELIQDVLTEDIAIAYRAKTLFDRSIELGILLPRSVLQFYRGEAFIEKQIMDVYQSIFVDEKEAREASDNAISEVFTSVFRWDVCSNLLGDSECTIDSFFDRDCFCAILPW